jgi:hypothetical protein
MVRLFPSYSHILIIPDNVTRCQLDAIPTVGYSDPILSYFSALQFTLDGVRMLKEGYQKVIYPPLYAPFLKLMVLLLSDKTRSIQNRQSSSMDGACCRPRAN